MRVHSSAEQMNLSESLVSRHPWFVAFLLATVATPAGVILGWLAPRPLDALVALPLVLVDMWAASNGITEVGDTAGNEVRVLRLLLVVLGIVLTWVFYVLAARLVLWRLLLHPDDGVETG